MRFGTSFASCRFGSSNARSIVGIAVVPEQSPGSDVTAPSLSAASATDTGTVTVSGGVTTSEANGTLYAFVSVSATPPSAATLIAGTGAVDHVSQVITTTGAKTFTFDGLTAATTYYAHYLHRDAAGNNSGIVTTASFATDANTGYAYTWPTYISESSTEEGFRYKTRTPIGSGAYTTSHTQGPSGGIGTTLAAVTTQHAYNTQFDGLVVAYDAVLGESSITYAPFQFWTSPSATAPVLTATAVALSVNVNLAWTHAGDPLNGGFIVYRNGVEIYRTAANIRSYAVTSGAPATAYGFTVRPYNSNPNIEGGIRPDSLGVISNTSAVTTNAPIPATTPQEHVGATNGAGNWWFGYYYYDEFYTAYPNVYEYSSGSHTWKDAFGRFALYGGVVYSPSNGQDRHPASLYIVPLTKTITISGSYAKNPSDAGNGVDITIKHNGTILLSVDGFNSLTPVPFSFTVSATAGDTITTFVADNGGNANDNTTVLLSITT